MAVGCHGAPQASGRPPWDHPCHFPFPNLISWHLGAHRSFLSLLAGSSTVGLHPRACKPCNCPVWRLKKEPRDNNRDINGLLDRGSYWSTAKGSGVTPHCERQLTSRPWQPSLLLGGERGYHLKREELTSGWLISYQGNQQLGPIPHSPSS